MNLKNALDNYVSTTPEVLGGTPVFKGTRVPIKILFDYLQGGDNIQEFLENYPTVNKIFAQKVLELLSTFLIEIETNNGTAA